MSPNVCVCAVVAFRSRHCPRGQTLNEDNTYSLHVTPPLRKHFVGRSCFFVFIHSAVIDVRAFRHRSVHLKFYRLLLIPVASAIISCVIALVTKLDQSGSLLAPLPFSVSVSVSEICKPIAVVFIAVLYIVACTWVHGLSLSSARSFGFRLSYPQSEIALFAQMVCPYRQQLVALSISC